MLRIIVLGAGAGGGFPQWNCDCEHCRRSRAGDPAARPLTQSSLVVSADDGANWYLLNASPDLRQQIAQAPPLWPRSGRRDSPIAGVVLTSADIDHVAGLLTMREGQRFTVYGTSRVLDAVKSNPIFNILDAFLVSWHPLGLGHSVELRSLGGDPTGVTVKAFPVPGKVALWLEDPSLPRFGSLIEDTVGLQIRSVAGHRFFYIPGCAALTEELSTRLRGADLVFFDGTTYVDEELIARGLGSKTATRMGHMSVSGIGGSIESFASLGVARKIFIHINNSNPILIDRSPERQAAEAAGWEIAFDGMEVLL